MKNTHEIIELLEEAGFQKKQSHAILNANLAMYNGIQESLDKINTRLDKFEAKMDTGFVRLEAKIDSKTSNNVTIVCTFFTILIALLLFYAEYKLR